MQKIGRIERDKGFTLVELIAVIAILSLLVGLSSIAFINIRRNTLEKQYDNLVSYIETKAANYADDTGITTVNVQTLIEEGYLEPDDETNIYNPVTNESINCKIINSEFVDGEFVPSFDRDNDYKNGDTCEKYEQTGLYKICIVNGSECLSEGFNLWKKGDIVLGVRTDDTYPLPEGTTYNWISTDGNSGTNSTIKVSGLDDSAIQAIYTVKVTEGLDRTGEARTKIGVDKQNPIVTEISVKDEAKWTENKDIEITLSDYTGSGVYGYYVSETPIDQCSNSKTDYQKTSDNKVTVEKYEQENISVCVMDNVENHSLKGIDKSISKICATTKEINFSISPEEDVWSKDKVTITVKAKDEKVGLEGYYFSTSDTKPDKDSNVWKKIAESKKYEEVNESYDVTENGTYYFHVLNTCGRVSTKEIVINNIDKEVDKSEIRLKSKVPSNTTYSESAIITGIARDNVSGIKAYQFTTSTSKTAPESGWENLESPIRNQERTYDLTIDKSGSNSYYFWVKDASGNTKRSPSSVSVKIDNDDPKCSTGNLTLGSGNVIGNSTCSDPTSTVTIYYYFKRTTSSSRPSTPSASMFTSTSKTYSTDCEYYYHGWAMAKDQAGHSSNIIYLGYQYSGACCNPRLYQSKTCDKTTGYYKYTYKDECNGGRTFTENSYDTCCDIKAYQNRTCNTNTGYYQYNYKNECTGRTFSESTSSTCCNLRTNETTECNGGKYRIKYYNSCKGQYEYETTTECCDYTWTETVGACSNGRQTITRRSNCGNTTTDTVACKSTPTFTISQTSLSMKIGETKSITYSYTGDGVVSCSPTSGTYATCTVNTYNKTITFRGNNIGTEIFTINASAGTYYSAGNPRTIRVTVTPLCTAQTYEVYSSTECSKRGWQDVTYITDSCGNTITKTEECCYDAWDGGCNTPPYGKNGYVCGYDCGYKGGIKNYNNDSTGSWDATYWTNITCEQGTRGNPSGSCREEWSYCGVQGCKREKK